MFDMAPDRGWLRSVSDYAATLGVTYPRPGLAGPAHVNRSCRWLGSRGGLCTRCALPPLRSALCSDPWGTISDFVEEFRDVDRATATADAVLAGRPVGPARARRAFDLLSTVLPLNPNVVSSLSTIETEHPGSAVADAAASLRTAATQMVTLLQRHASGNLYLPLIVVARSDEADVDTLSPAVGGSAPEPSHDVVLAVAPVASSLAGASALLLAGAHQLLCDGGHQLALVPRVAAEECLPVERWTSATTAGRSSLTEALERTRTLAHVLPHVLTLAQQTSAPLGDLLDAVRHAHA